MTGGPGSLKAGLLLALLGNDLNRTGEPPRCTRVADGLFSTASEAREDCGPFPRRKARPRRDLRDRAPGAEAKAGGGIEAADADAWGDAVANWPGSAGAAAIPRDIGGFHRRALWASTGIPATPRFGHAGLGLPV